MLILSLEVLIADSAFFVQVSIKPRPFDRDSEIMEDVSNFGDAKNELGMYVLCFYTKALYKLSQILDSYRFFIRSTVKQQWFYWFVIILVMIFYANDITNIG